MSWTTIRIQVATPVFNSDTDQRSSGIRVPSLRGAMRFWFRALAGTVTGNDISLLAALESSVFGSTDHSSPVKLRIPTPPLSAKPGRAAFVTDGIGYLLGQGLVTGGQLSRGYVPPENGSPQAFDLQARFTGPEEARALALASLWLTCTYGGLGARVRRGFGGLRISGSDDTLPTPWTPETLRTPGPDYFVDLDQLGTAGPLADYRTWLSGLPNAPADLLQRQPREAGSLPGYPVLGPHTTASLHPQPGTWSSLLSMAGREWRYFRASEDSHSPHGDGIRTPEWTAVINGEDTHFALGALGLPVGYSKAISVNAFQAGEELRRPSPVWLRPVGTGSQMRLLSFAFLSEFLPQGPESPTVQIKENGRPPRSLTVQQQDLTELAELWIDGMRNGTTFIRE